MNPHKLQRRHRRMLKRMLRQRGHYFEAESRDQLRESAAGHADGIILTAFMIQLGRRRAGTQGA
jgi:hypothetical protein